MTDSTKRACKRACTSLLALCVMAPAYANEASTQMAEKPVIEVVQTKTDKALRWTDKKMDETARRWERLGVERKVDRFQSKVRPIGYKIEAGFDRYGAPIKKASIWGERHMSLPAIFLMLVFSFVAVLLFVSGPISRLGGRH